jgi:signal transduction histidine kinase/DNA-binding LacI/PurR family transcriptional regulator
MKRDGRTTIGVLIGLVNTGYYKSILSGIMDFAREKDLNLRCFATNLINAPRHWESDKNILFTMVDRTNVDGLIIPTSALENYIGRDALADFFDQYRSLPLTSIGREVAGAPSFVIDNEKGLLELLAHLADRHSYRRLAFIAGPPLNSEAAVRFETYRKFLVSRGLPFDPALVFEGDFTGQSGKRAVHAFFRERRTAVDAIVAANDMMAFGAIEELRRWGVQVPGDTFVVGFDDIETSGDANLTTVRQPLSEQGYEAAAALHRLLENGEAPPLTVLPTSTVIRGSCGCPSTALRSCRVELELSRARSRGPRHGGGSGRRSDAEELAERLAAVASAKGDAYLPWLGKLADAFLRSAAARDEPAFLAVWRKMLFWGTLDGRDASLLDDIVSELRRYAFPRRRAGRGGLFLEDQLHQARVLIDEALRQDYALMRISAEIQEEHFTNIDLSLTGVGDLNEQLRVIYSEFPALGVHSCYLSLFDDPFDPMGRARLILAYEDDEKIELPARGISFPVKELIPASLYPAGRRHNFVVKSLEHRDHHLGFILMELGDDLRSAGIFDYLCPKLASMLQMAIFIENTVNQTRALDRANKRLAESNRALENFAALASHDLQEPLRKILTFGDRLAGGGGDVLGEQGRDYLARMQRSALRMRRLIDSLLVFSQVDTVAASFTTVDLNVVVKEVLSELDALMEKTGARAEVGNLPVVYADPVQMRQLFLNLIGNALKFQPPGARPEVKIGGLPAEAEGNPAVIVEDNGVGIAPEYHEKIFGVFQRLHSRREYEGDGMGLAICRKIMERHGGSIGVESEEGAGARFVLWFGARKPRSGS